MANKVLSIKIDEKDLENLKKYHEILIDLGFISNETLKMNGFLKHLLLDNLAYDFSTMLNMYSEYAMDPQCADPEVVDGDGIVRISNSYGFDEKTFKEYKNCFKERLAKALDNMKQCTNELIKITGLDLMVDGGAFHEIKILPDREIDNCGKFWLTKAFEQKECYKRQRKTKGVEQDITMIMQSNIPEDAKQRLVEQIRKYDKDKENNFALLEGKGYLE